MSYDKKEIRHQRTQHSYKQDSYISFHDKITNKSTFSLIDETEIYKKIQYRI